MTTAQDWINEVKRHLLSGERENINRLASSPTSGATTVTYEFDQGGIMAGATIEIDTELMYVWSVNTGTKVATVQRGMFGSTAAAHTSGALITVNPRFPQFHIFNTLNQELLDLSSPANGLYRVAVEEITSAAGITGYDLSLTDFISPIEVFFEASASEKWWKRSTNWRVQENADTTDFASGRTLQVFDDTGAVGGSVRLTYRRAFDVLTGLSDDVNSVTGIPVEATDIPPLGAAGRLLLHRAARRTFDESQGEPRRAQEVEANAATNAASALLGFRQRRINAEVARLNALYPTRLVG